MSELHHPLHFLDSLLPNSILNDRKLKLAVRIRARAMVGVLALSIVVPFIALVYFVILHLSSGIDFSFSIIGTMTVLVVLMSQHLVFQSYGNLRATALAYDIHLFLSLIIAIFVSGGWHSPAVILLPCSPMVTFMTVGYRASLANTAIVFLVAVIFFTLEIKGVAMPLNYMPENTREYGAIVMWFMFFSLLVLLLNTSEALLNGSEKNE